MRQNKDGMNSDIYVQIRFKLKRWEILEDYIILNESKWPWPWVKVSRKTKPSAPIIYQNLLSISKEFSMLLRLVKQMNLMLILSRPINVQAREFYVVT